MIRSVDYSSNSTGTVQPHGDNVASCGSQTVVKATDILHTGHLVISSYSSTLQHIGWISTMTGGV